MKKLAMTLVLLTSFFVPFVKTSAANEIKWGDFKESCFAKSGLIQGVPPETFRMEMDPVRSLFFVQNNDVLPYKTDETRKDEYQDYKVLSLTGGGSATVNWRDLNDSNLETGAAFDPYSKQKKEILIDLTKTLSKDTFEFRNDYTGHFAARTLISQDNANYIEVGDPRHYDFRYLKIQFENLDSAAKTSDNLFVKEVNFIVRGKATLLVTPVTADDVRVFADYRCEETQAFRQFIGQIEEKARRARYSLSVNTVTIHSPLAPNPAYNDDVDNDGVNNEDDNCPNAYNPGQTDTDGDGIGDACDLEKTVKNFYEQDADYDGVGNGADNCPYVFNPQQTDFNADNIGDACADDDGDGIIGYKDNCPEVANPDQKDVNVNGIGDVCEFDKDSDGVFDGLDNCITKANPDQADKDGDGIGDACDNCELYNPDQMDRDQNGRGDVCDAQEKFLKENDADGDGIVDFKDNCRLVANSEQEDRDKDGVGDACDNCPAIQNADQRDDNKNGVGDLCEDADGDGIVGYKDNCPAYANADQKDSDNNGVGDLCEDADGDGIAFAVDNCPFVANANQWDVDGDGKGDACDTKDNRFLESNTWVVTGLGVLMAGIFAFLIVKMLRKLK